MSNNPPSGISALTAGGATILLALTVVAVVLGWVPAYVLVLSAALVAVIVFNIWAARGTQQ